MTLPYDASPLALTQPGSRPTVFDAAAPRPGLEGLCAELARLAYLHFESDPAQAAQLTQALARAGIAGFRAFSNADTDTQALGLRLAGGEAVVVFRGTQPERVTDIGTDLEATLTPWPRGGRVHEGFAEAFRSVQGPIGAWLAQSGAAARIFTGHSLGAALATLAAAHWQPGRLITFGSPRVGDAAFVATLAGTPIDRFVDCCDIVTFVPPSGPWYRHAGPMRYIDAHGHLGSDPQAVDADRLKGRLDYIEHHAWKIGHLPARELADHAPINYVRAFF